MPFCAPTPALTDGVFEADAGIETAQAGRDEGPSEQPITSPIEQGRDPAGRAALVAALGIGSPIYMLPRPLVSLPDQGPLLRVRARCSFRRRR